MPHTGVQQPNIAFRPRHPQNGPDMGPTVTQKPRPQRAHSGATKPGRCAALRAIVYLLSGAPARLPGRLRGAKARGGPAGRQVARWRALSAWRSMRRCSAPRSRRPPLELARSPMGAASLCRGLFWAARSRACPLSCLKSGTAPTENDALAWLRAPFWGKIHTGDMRMPPRRGHAEVFSGDLILHLGEARSEGQTPASRCTARWQCSAPTHSTQETRLSGRWAWTGCAATRRIVMRMWTATLVGGISSRSLNHEGLETDRVFVACNCCTGAPGCHHHQIYLNCIAFACLQSCGLGGLVDYPV